MAGQKTRSGATRRQHWVPRFYLRHFADADGRLWAYRRDSDSIYRTHIKDVCVQYDLYEVRHSGPESGGAGKSYMPNLIERKLSELEGHLAQGYERFLDCCEKEEQDGATLLDGRAVLCELAANLIVRHPAAVADGRGTANWVASWLRENAELMEELRPVLNWSEWGGDYDALAGLTAQATSLFSDDPAAPARRTAEELSEKGLMVLEAPDDAAFITASTPLFVTGPEDDSYDFDELYMPLNGRYAVLFSNGGHPAYAKLTCEGANCANCLMLLNSKHWDLVLAAGRDSLGLAVGGWKDALRKRRREGIIDTIDLASGKDERRGSIDALAAHGLSQFHNRCRGYC